jgi:hypothetical protein
MHRNPPASTSDFYNISLRIDVGLGETFEPELTPDSEMMSMIIKKLGPNADTNPQMVGR